MSQIKAKTLYNSKKFKEGKKLLLEAVQEEQKKLTQILPPNPKLTKKYQSLIKKIGKVRSLDLFFPYIGSGLGNGPLVELLDGSVKYDFIGGIGPLYFGHSHLKIIDSSIEAALSDVVMEGNLQQNLDLYTFSDTLLKISKMDHCLVTTSGAMANENAVKILFQKKYPAFRILAFEHCFMGRTWALSQITDKPDYREHIPSNVLVDYIPFFDPQNPKKSIKQAKEKLLSYLKRHPNQYAFMVFELVQGDGGFNVGEKTFFSEIMKILKQHRIAIFVDEVQTFARTYKPFAYQHFGLEKYVDIVTVGKITQACATLFKSEFKPRPGLISQTFTSSVTAIRAGTVILQELMQGNYFGKNGKNAKIYRHFLKRFQEIEKKYPKKIQGPYGIGTMIGFTPLGGEPKKVQAFVKTLFSKGVMSFMTGGFPKRVRFLVPAGCINHHHIDEVMDIVEDTLKRF